ncbi:MAG TPA: GGDEF domain-containing protein [Symbiobacteriaceae bacterium]|nr:GGDEF domain-containing protein [Symbiobacteriaceae bacterium]
MTAFLSVSLAIALAALAWQYFRSSQLAAARDHLEKELQQIALLAGTVSVGDWVRSVQGLAGALVQSGTCQAAVLMAVADNGVLEQRAAAHRQGAPEWAPAVDEGIRQVIEKGEAVQVRPDGVLLPVVEDGELVGILAVQGAVPDARVLQVAVRLAGLGLTGLRLYQKQAVLSNTDGLTGLANHRHFQQALSVALAQAYLEGEPLALVLLDIDHFKTVNDTYGHLFGDLVLRELAYLLRRELPDDAMAARYGGEEFAIVLRGELARNAVGVAEGIRAAVAEHQVFDFSSGTRLSVTISLGVAQYELGQGKSRLVARADEALYASKHSGRNRVTVALPENSTSHLFPS